jgi:hypothetical protein
MKLTGIDICSLPILLDICEELLEITTEAVQTHNDLFKSLWAEYPGAMGMIYSGMPQRDFTKRRKGKRGRRH